MRRLRPPLFAAAGGLVLAASLPAHGQSLVALYESARAFDATFQGARAQYEATYARAAQAKAGLLPQVGLQASASRTEARIRTDQGTGPRDFNTQQAGVQATQPIYRPANWATYEQGKRQYDIAQAQLALAEQDLIVRVSQAYFDVLGSQDSLALVRAQKAAVAEQRAAAQRNFDVGNATITDTREAQARYDLVLAQEIAAENDLQVKRIALDQLVGRSGTTPWPLAAPARLPVPAPAGAETWVAQAEDGHPAIAQARLALDVAGLEIDKAKAGHKPVVDATLSYGVQNNPDGVIDSTLRTRVKQSYVGVQMTLPLFAGFAVENRVRETVALEDQARAQLDATRRNVTQATRAAYLGLLAGANQVKALESAEASSQSALDANRLGYQVGVRINIDVLNAQSQLYQTKRDLALARYNVLLGNLKLRQANGSLRPEDLQPIEATLASSAGAGTEPSAATQSPVPVPAAR
ncbi:MAG: TolC family outer membrane protein [Pseudomonadota bacterium]|nr:TolC family outer membrane protein [Pseudomonadota bacterium]